LTAIHAERLTAKPAGTKPPIGIPFSYFVAARHILTFVIHHSNLSAFRTPHFTLHPRHSNFPPPAFGYQLSAIGHQLISSPARTRLVPIRPSRESRLLCDL
jgi:hypothetical protein